MKQEGKTIPVEYEQYLQDFNMVGGDNSSISDVISKNATNFQDTISKGFKELAVITSQDLSLLESEIKNLEKVCKSIETTQNANNTALNDKMNKDLKNILETYKTGKDKLLRDITALIGRFETAKETLINKYINDNQEQNKKMNELLTNKMGKINEDFLLVKQALVSTVNKPSSNT